MQIGFVGLLTLVFITLFITLKLTGAIAWSWLWVLSPMWITAIVWIAVVAYLVGRK